MFCHVLQAKIEKMKTQRAQFLEKLREQVCVYTVYFEYIYEVV